MKIQLLILLGLVACGDQQEPVVPEPFTRGEVARILHLSPLPPLPGDPTNAVADDPRAARLGQRLFFDVGFSRDGNRSCATCHQPELAFTDGRQVALGLWPLDRHTPTIINSAYQRWQFWDGRTESQWAQALVPLESPLEHASSRLQIAHVIAGDPVLRSAYEELFGSLPPLEDAQRFPPVGRPVPPDDHAHQLATKRALETESRAQKGSGGGHEHAAGGFYHPHQRAWDGMAPGDQEAVTRVFVNVGKAIAAYERRLIAGRSNLDRFVEGLRDGDPQKLASLGPASRRGLKLFLGEAQCHLCHSGPLLSDLEFHDLGLEDDDPGRGRGLEELRRSSFLGTGAWSDDPEGEARIKIQTLPTHRHGGFEFRTPSLRNVAVTAPYMHDGRYETLAEVIDFYSELTDQRGSPPTMETILRPLSLTDGQRSDLVAFLEHLTDVKIDPTLTGPIE